MNEETKAGSELSARLGVDPLTGALLAASEELATEYMWCFDGDPGVPPIPDHFFIQVMRKHLTPLFDSATWKQARIAALKAELAALEEA